MIDPDRVLRPIRESADALQRLQDYDSTEDLAAAVGEVWRAIDRSLRFLLRSDTKAPDEARLAALSEVEMPTSRLLDLLRRRALISLALAAAIHELAKVADRAAAGEVTPNDGDLALQVADRLKREVIGVPRLMPVREVAHDAVENGALDERPQSPSQPVPHPVPPSRPRDRPLALVGAGLASLAILALIFVLLRSFDRDLSEGVAAFQDGRLEVAEQRFRTVTRDAPDNLTARLYLGRIYRRQERYDLAAQELQEAARLDRSDPDVRRELGHLFLELGRPAAAAEQYRRAVELEPEDEKNWVGLILALRAANDPLADDVLRRAPEAARATLAESDAGAGSTNNP